MTVDEGDNAFALCLSSHKQQFVDDECLIDGISLISGSRKDSNYALVGKDRDLQQCLGMTGGNTGMDQKSIEAGTNSQPILVFQKGATIKAKVDGVKKICII